MWWPLFLCFVLNVHNLNIVRGNEAKFENDVWVLFDNLIQSLRKDPLLSDAEFTPGSKRFVDEQIGRFKRLHRYELSPHQSRLKREASENETESVDIHPFLEIPANFPQDIHFFEQNSTWYALILESSSKEVYGDELLIKKYENNEFRTVTGTKTINGVRATSFPLQSSTIIAVAENASNHLTSIYEFTQDEQLQQIQMINVSYAAHVALWSVGGDVFMMLAERMEEDGNRTFEVEMPVYKWHETYFDVTQYVRAAGKVSPFAIGDQSYIVLADSLQDEDNGKMYSEILKYDLQTEEYRAFQRLPTTMVGGTDVKYFKTDLNGEEEDFIIVTSGGHASGGVSCNSSGTPLDHLPSFTLPAIGANIYKFVDDYFIPFQGVHLEGVREWQPITTKDGDTVLLAPSCDGLRCLKYDGWRFQKCKVNFTSAAMGAEEAEAIHYEKFLGKNVLVMVDEENKSRLSDVSFASRNKLKDLYDEMLSWCQDNIRLIDSMKDEDVLGERGDVVEETEPDSDSQTEAGDELNLLRTLNRYDVALSELRAKLDGSVKTINRDLNLTDLILNGRAVVGALDAETINGVGIDNLIEGVLDVKEGFEVDGLEFESMRTERPIVVGSVNGVKPDDVMRTTDDLVADGLVVEGEVAFTQGLTLREGLNDVKIDSRHVLLVEQPQNLTELRAKSIVTDVLTISFPNGISTHKPGFKNLNVTNLRVDGFLNGFDVATLEKRALKTAGDQTINRTFYFDHLEVTNLETKNFSGVSPDVVFLRIDEEGRRFIDKDVKFFSDIEADNLVATEFLNNVPVKDGRLDVLLRNVTQDRQYISGVKSFENLELLNSIKLRGKIRGEAFAAISPLLTIENEVIREGDVRITGEVVIEDVVSAGDFVGGENSLERVRTEGIRVDEEDVLVPLRLAQHIDVDQLYAERINGIDPSLWVVNGAKQPQTIWGRKRVMGDVEITGDTNVLKVNDIDMGELEKNVLRIEREQTVEGRHHVRYAVMRKNVASNATTFGGKPWKDLVTTNDEQVIGGTFVLGKNLQAASLSANTIDLLGSINGVNLTKLATDAIRNNTDFKVFGLKTFHNLTVDSLRWRPGFDIIRDFDGSSLSLPGLNLWSVFARNVEFKAKLNNKTHSDLEDIVSDERHEIVVDEDWQFDKLKVHGNVYIETGLINGVDINEIVDNTVKVDEPFHFDNAEFGTEIRATQGIQLDGQVEHLDLENVFENNSDQPQTLTGQITFEDDVFLDGIANIAGPLNGVDFSKLCAFISNGTEAKNLTVRGNAHFAKGPQVLEFNRNNVEHIMNKTWLADRYTVINNSVRFNNITVFEDSITLSGLFNGISLENLSVTYMSKTKDQHIQPKVLFEQITFRENVASPKLTIDGRINGIDLREFTKQTLLHRYQLFEDELYFENCGSEETNGDFTVNGLSLESDVMRYDKVNKVTGLKEIKNLKTDILRLERNVNVDNVDVIRWMNNSVLKTGHFRIPGKKLLRNATFIEGINVRSSFNGFRFDEGTVLLDNVPQNITGRMVFVPELPRGLKFKVLQVKGLVNNVDIGELVQNQVSERGDNVFRSSVNFLDDIRTRNLNLLGLYRGVNVTELVANLTHLEGLDNMRENYEKLLAASAIVETSLKTQAYYLKDYRPIQSIPGIDKIFSMGDKLITVGTGHDGVVLHFLDWNEDGDVFQEKGAAMVLRKVYPTFLSTVKLDGIDYLYVEQPKGAIITEDQLYEGKLIHFGTNITNFHSIPFETKGTLHLTSFYSPASHHQCMLFIDYFYNINVVCKTSEDEEYQLLDTIDDEHAFMVTTLNVNNCSYLVTVRNSNVDYARTTFWKFNAIISRFERYQTIYDGEPTYVDAITSPYGHFIAVVYGYIPKTMNFGKIVIKRFDESTGKFEVCQAITVQAPLEAQFALLPSHELALYIVTRNFNALDVYTYEGISGFVKKFAGTVAPAVSRMYHFSNDKGHYVLLQDSDEIIVTRAVFNGKRWE